MSGYRLEGPNQERGDRYGLRGLARFLVKVDSVVRTQDRRRGGVTDAVLFNEPSPDSPTFNLRAVRYSYNPQIDPQTHIQRRARTHTYVPPPPMSCCWQVNPWSV